VTSSFIICFTIVVFPALSSPLASIVSIQMGRFLVAERLTASEFSSLCPLSELFSILTAFRPNVSSRICCVGLVVVGQNPYLQAKNRDSVRI
jgi:hypothetical protein